MAVPDLFPGLQSIRDDDRSIPQHVLDVLAVFGYPVNAFAGAVQGALSEDPNESALTNAYRGLTGQQAYHFGDILGIEKPDESADTADYLGQLIKYEAPQFILDPLNLLFAPAKAAGVFPRIAKGAFPFLKEGQSLAGKGAELAGAPKLAEKFAGSPFGKLFTRRLDYDDTVRAWEESIDAIKREHNPDQYAKMFLAVDDAVNEASKQFPGVTKSDIFEAMEKPGTHPELQPVVDILRPMQDKMDELFAKRNIHLQKLGAEPKAAIEASDEYRYMPHRLIDYREPDAYTQKGRKIWRWVDTTTGEETIGTAAEAGVKERDGKFFSKKLHHWGQPEEATPRDLHFLGIEKPPTHMMVSEGRLVPMPNEVERLPVSLEEMRPLAGEHKIFVDDPSAAMFMDISMRNRQIEFLRTLKATKDQGLLSDVPVEGWRGINVKGFDQFQAPKAVANRLENMGKGLFDPESAAGSLNELVDNIVNSRAGKAGQGLTQYWKEFVLAHPGWYFGNLASNFPQAYQEITPLMIPYRLGQAAKTQIEGGPRLAEWETRGLAGTGQYGEMPVGQEVARRLGTAMGQEPGTLGKISEATKKALFIPQIFKAGAKTEDAFKIAVAEDWLAKNVKNLDQLSPDEQAKAFDRAARVAHDALGNYSRQAMTPFMRNIAALPIPFAGWLEHMTRSTARLATQQPQKLNRLGMTLDAMFEPLSEEDKAVADPWIKEQAPVRKFLNIPLGESSTGTPNIAMLARFLPQGMLEQFVKRPGDAAISWVNPFLKAPAELGANKSAFRGREIDALAGGFPQSLYNPILSAVGAERPYEMATNKMFGQSVPAGWEYIAGISPWGRHLKEADALGTAAGLWTDPNREPMSPEEAGIYQVTGGKFYPFDRARYEKRRKWEAGKEESKIKSNLNYARKRGDMDGMTFYQRQLDQLRSRRAGMVEN